MCCSEEHLLYSEPGAKVKALNGFINARALNCLHVSTAADARRRAAKINKSKLNDFLEVSVGFPYLKDNVASISVPQNQMNYVFGSAWPRRKKGGEGVSANCQN